MFAGPSFCASFLVGGRGGRVFEPRRGVAVLGPQPLDQLRGGLDALGKLFAEALAELAG